MAFSDGPARFWQVDLTTRLGAEAAAHQGGTACFAITAMAILGTVFAGGFAGLNTAEGLSILVAAAVEAVIGLIAGFRLRAGKGAYWGTFALVLTAIECIGKLFMFSPGGVVITAIICVFMFNGIRGAFALKSSAGFDDDVVDVFR